MFVPGLHTNRDSRASYEVELSQLIQYLYIKPRNGKFLRILVLFTKDFKATDYRQRFGFVHLRYVFP